MTALGHSILIREIHAGGKTRLDDPIRELVGFDGAELSAKPLIEWIHPEDRAAMQAAIQKGEGGLRARHLAEGESWVELFWKLSQFGGSIVALASPEEPQVSTASLTHDPAHRVHSVGSIRETMGRTLDAMVSFVEECTPGFKCSVLIIDEDGYRINVGAAPSLPANYNAKVEGLAIGPFVGSCGTAAYWNTPVIVENIAEDPLWVDLAQAALDAGLQACWSLPIRSKDGEVLGAMALYAPVPCVPNEAQLSQMNMAAHMVGSAVERGRVELALRKSEAEARGQARLLSTLTEVVTTFVDTGDWPTAGRALMRVAAELSGSCVGYLVNVADGEPRILSHEDTWVSQLERRVDDMRQWASPRLQAQRVLARHGEVFCRVISTKETQCFESEGNVEPFIDNHPAASPSMLRLLVAPIAIQGEVAAMIGIAEREEGPYSWEDFQRLELLARTASVLLASHRSREHELTLEEELRQAGKMEALGVLAGRIAHDFNNLLVAILGNAELAMESLDKDSEAQDMLDGVINAGNRAADLCKQMLAYAGRGALSKQTLDCNAVIRELAPLLQVSLSPKTALELSLSDSSLMMRANKTQFRQVIMNVVSNADEALAGETGQICLTVGRRNYESAALGEFRRGYRIQPGEYIEIGIRDSGAGMSSETAKRIFDPFYTTRASGRGLGLAAVQGIVLGHRGGIRVKSEVGVGTELTVILPFASQEDVDSTQELVLEPSAAIQRVLVVDDEDAVRQVTAKILQHAGFEVLTAIDGEEAVEIYEREKDAIDCVLLDLSMPRLDGEATFKELRRIRNDVRVVLNSGFTESEMLERFEGAGFADVLQKPFPSKALVEKLRRVMA